MGMASFSFSYNSPQQNAEEAVFGMKEEYKEAYLNVLLGEAVRGVAWGLLDTVYETKLSDEEKKQVAEDAVGEFIDQFNRPGSLVYERFDQLVTKCVKDQYIELMNWKAREQARAEKLKISEYSPVVIKDWKCEHIHDNPSAEFVYSCPVCDEVVDPTWKACPHCGATKMKVSSAKIKDSFHIPTDFTNGATPV